AGAHPARWSDGYRSRLMAYPVAGRRGSCLGRSALVVSVGTRGALLAAADCVGAGRVALGPRPVVGPHHGRRANAPNPGRIGSRAWRGTRCGAWVGGAA